LTAEFGDWCRDVCTLYKACVRDTSDLMQHIIDKWASISQNVERVGQWRKEQALQQRRPGLFDAYEKNGESDYVHAWRQ